jgi:hypothetical protein
LEEHFGEIDYTSEELLFSWTSYYNEEMGSPIFRKFFSFKELVDPGILSSVKMKSNDLEDFWKREGRRHVNLDPGLLGLGRLVLASTKGPGHRIALEAGIYAEITLYYRAKHFQVLPWTYPDFRSPEYQVILGDIRDLYHSQIKAAGWDCSDR